MDNMTIGPIGHIGGNAVQMTKDGKIQVTNSKGKIKTLSQDEFEKNILKNADKINNGEDFEFKKDRNKSLKIITAAVGTAIVTTSIIYRKEIGKYLKNFSFKKLWQDIKGLFESRFDKNAPAGYSKQERHTRLNDLKETFRNYDADARFNARTEFLKKNNVSEEQFSLMQQISRLGRKQDITEEQKALLPVAYRTKKACVEFAEKVRSVMLDGPTRPYARKTFMPKNNEDWSKISQTFETSAESATARKTRLLANIEKSRDKKGNSSYPHLEEQLKVK